MRDRATERAAPYFHANWGLGDRQHFLGEFVPLVRPERGAVIRL